MMRFWTKKPSMKLESHSTTGVTVSWRPCIIEISRKSIGFSKKFLSFRPNKKQATKPQVKLKLQIVNSLPKPCHGRLFLVFDEQRSPVGSRRGAVIRSLNRWGRHGILVQD